MPVSPWSPGSRWVAIAAALTVAVLPLAASAAPVSAAPVSAAAWACAHSIRVGSVVIPPCASSRLAWCTTINVPYQYVGRDPAAAGTIKLGFQWCRRSAATRPG